MPKSREDLRNQAVKLWRNAKWNSPRQARIQEIYSRYLDNISKTPEDKAYADAAKVLDGTNRQRERKTGSFSTNLAEAAGSVLTEKDRHPYSRDVYMQGRVANQQSTTATMAKASGGKG